MNPQSGTEHVVSVRAVKKMYPLGKTEIWALWGIDFDLNRGDFISITGPSGSEVIFSGQATWFLTGTELSVGGFYQPSGDKSPRLVATTGFKLFDLDCYTESLLFWGNDQ